MYGLSTIYDKYNNTIYTMNPSSHYSTDIWSLDFNAKSINDMSWNKITNKLLMSRSNTCICMVDKGRLLQLWVEKVQVDINIEVYKQKELNYIQLMRISR
eukprot:116331_1